MKLVNRHVISVDEKTSIQALERKSGRAPQSKGAHKRIEFEYKRHGAATLIAAVNVENGKVLHHRLGNSHKEGDFAAFIKAAVAMLPEMDEVIILADQLDTHKSEALVRWLAEEDGEEVGRKGKSGILKNQASRMAYLESGHHRVRFLFTPKHCSWLNPIENWFAKLQRHVIKEGSFNDKADLCKKINEYIVYHNAEMAKPLKWVFAGFKKQKRLAS